MLVRQSVRFLSEILFTPVVLLIALALVRAAESPSVRRYTAVGAWIGVANLIRPTLVLFPIWMAVVLLLAGRSRASARLRRPSP